MHRDCVLAAAGRRGLHADPGFPLGVGDRVSIGHRAILHGCTIEDVLVGMGVVIMNGAVVGEGSSSRPVRRPLSGPSGIGH